MTYFLAFAVVAIWGTVIYKLVGGSSDSSAVYYAPVEYGELVQKDSLEKFTLKLNYRDPFLGKAAKTYSPTKSKPKPVKAGSSSVSSSKAKDKKVDEVKWPKVRVVGVFENAGKMVASVSVNDRPYIIKKGDIVGEVEFGVMAGDSVNVKFSGKEKYFKAGI